MIKKLKKIRPRVLLSHVIVTLAYPAVKAYISKNNRLLIFTDSMTIIAMLLLVGGVIYAMVLRGDFDISAFVFRRGACSIAGRRYHAYMENAEEGKDPAQSFQTYKKIKTEKREDAFNYPLFLGILYLAAAAVIAWAVF
jgi:hypothetical protein